MQIVAPCPWMCPGGGSAGESQMQLSSDAYRPHMNACCMPLRQLPP